MDLPGTSFNTSISASKEYWLQFQQPGLIFRHSMLWSKCLCLMKNMYILIGFVIQFMCLNLEQRWKKQTPMAIKLFVGKSLLPSCLWNWLCCFGSILLHWSCSFPAQKGKAAQSSKLALLKVPLCWEKMQIFSWSQWNILEVHKQAHGQDLRCSGLRHGLARHSQRSSALSQGAFTWPAFRPFKDYDAISHWDTVTEFDGGSSGRVKVPGLVENGVPSTLLRALCGHKRLEQPPIDPGSRTLRRVPLRPWQSEIWVFSKLIAIVLLNPEENWEQNWRFDTLFPLAFNHNSCPSCSLYLWKIHPIKARIFQWP